ncbi:MAG: nucleotide disphospho-sugar-binding domain-containing protein [Patulibacter sp.]
MSRRLLLGAFGDAGHAFPIMALGRRLAERGNDVWVQTWDRWQADIEAAGMRFASAPEYPVFPQLGQRPLDHYEAATRAAIDTLPLVDEVRPHAVVSDILTLGPALAGELRGAPVATLIPHLDPRGELGWPPFSSGARPARTRAGRALWERLGLRVDRSLDQGQDELNRARATVGLPPVPGHHGGISRQLALVGSVPQLDYPRTQPRVNTHTVGPFVWEPPSGDLELPPGDAPLVVVAPSTIQDPEGDLLRAALHGLAGAPVRVLAAHNRVSDADTVASEPIDVPDNATLVPWMRYSQVMPEADVILCHAGHGTLLRALSYGKPVVAIPAAGDMFENAARLAWSGAGLRLPRRLAGARAVRSAVLTALSDPSYATKAAEIAAWIAAGDGVDRAAPLVEAFADRR